jgi:hypothetical protein
MPSLLAVVLFVTSASDRFFDSFIVKSSLFILRGGVESFFLWVEVKLPHRIKEFSQSEIWTVLKSFHIMRSAIQLKVTKFNFKPLIPIPMKFTIAAAALVTVGLLFMDESDTRQATVVDQVETTSRVDSLLSSLNEMPSAQGDVNDLLSALNRFPTGSE